MLNWINRKLNLEERWDRYRRLIPTLGLRGTFSYRFQYWRGGRPGSVYWLHPRDVIHPVALRHHTSDLYVFDQIFLRQEYAPVYDMTGAGLVIDCGANVGYSAAVFLSRFPDCHVVAVEPDPENFAAMQRNLAPYGSRVTLVQAGVWSHTVPLVMSEDTYRDGTAWTKQVRLCRPDEDADFEGVAISTLLATSGFDQISLLKVDVEGAEAVIFGSNVDWLDKVDAIAIELHDDSYFGKSSEIFFAAIKNQPFDVSHSGDLLICRRHDRPVAGRS